ncbi:hypothetical protein OJF2_37130 [Aquisphaera giovannonii]|uniref:Sulfatase n=1 Tax=Aquisphaera giovannonii TaxID=406548 RepID=A0A5B9W3K3_9BACT|nr:DUF1501 domain-containing protein [Aquisphaera giovannonii]QEH35168.1 hypothetical protein OJF2_37130 [Aquisphaera giovannonii]
MNDPIPHAEVPLTRREMLLRGGAGFGSLALLGMLGDSPLLAATTPAGTPAAGGASWTLPARAKSCIFLFMEGGPSHIDTFDPKPLVNALAGKPLPASFKPVITPMGEAGSPILPVQRKWARHGEGGLWVSDWLPHLAGCADDLVVIRSCWSNGLNHVGGVCQMNTGSILAGRPSLGSWVSYGLGTENRDLPCYVVLQDSNGLVAGGPRNWGSGFMPATHQGIRLGSGSRELIPNLSTPGDVGEARQRGKLAFLGRLNARHAERHPDQTELDARIRAYELAFRMQAEAPGAVDLADESEETRSLYGLDRKETSAFARNCLLARRLVERGVRFVQLYHGAGAKWDAHSGIEKNHAELCRSMDRPVAGLLRDLKRRGLLDQTLVVWGGEFGRTPMSEKGDGRDHNPYGFTMWMAGAGLRGGRTVGATDEVGLHAVEDRLHVHDLHATILHLMGADHSRLVYLHKGRPERATQNEGVVSESILRA